MLSPKLLQKYADLLVHYCLDIKEGERLYINTTTLAAPLVQEVFRHAIRAGALVDIDLGFQDRERIFLEEAQSEEQLRYISPIYAKAMNEFEAYLSIRAPFVSTNKIKRKDLDVEKLKIRENIFEPLHQSYFRRIATRELKRNLCQYPTPHSAQNAGMTLVEYEKFVVHACKLDMPDPKQAWLQVRQWQQQIVDVLNTKEEIHYKGDGIDIKFSTKGRTWINSDGQTNMPSGEVYTSPIENSVNGVVHFSFPSIYEGQEVEGVTLWVKDGYIEKWEAKKNKAYLDKIFAISGARRFGEAAIGTNYNITQMTKNILFDEKIGGTIHMAIGQSYLQCGGKNESTVHWDMISNMKNGGQIYANGEKIYEDGQFLFVEKVV